MPPSPLKIRRRSRNTHEISQNICAAVKEVYYDSSKQVFRRACSDLLALYKDEDIIINREEFTNELQYRVEIFLDGAKSQEGQYRVFKFLALLASKAYIDQGDLTLIDTLCVSIHKKKYHEKDTVRQAATALIGRLLYCTIRDEPTEDNVDFQKYYASHLPEQTFAELFEVLWYLSADLSEDVRAEVLSALSKLQKYPGLMEVVNTAQIQTVQELFILGLRDPSETVRCQAICCMNVTTNNEAMLLLQLLMNETSEYVRLIIAKKLTTDVPIALISRKERMAFLKCKNLLLSDTIVPEYYAILYAWSCDLFCERSGIEYSDLEPKDVLTGLYILLESLRYSKDLHQIFLRLLDYLKNKFCPGTDEKTYISFAKLFDYENSPYINELSYLQLLETSSYCNMAASLKEKQYKLFMWQMLSEYCCHPSLLEETKIECRTVLLPTMTEYASFVKRYWDMLAISSDNLKQMENARLFVVQQSSATILLSIFHSLDGDEIGMYEWKNLLVELLTGYSFNYEPDLITLIVHDYFYYHFNRNREPSRTAMELLDLMNIIGDVGDMNSTQDVFHRRNCSVQPYSPPHSQSHINPDETSQIFDAGPSAAEGGKPYVINMDPQKLLRAINVLAAVFKCGFFVKHEVVLDGLVTDYAIYIIDHPISIAPLESRRASFICIAGMAPFLNLEDFNFIRAGRIVLEDDKQSKEIKNIALMMISDVLQVHGYERVRNLYFFEVESAAECDLIDELIGFCSDPDLAPYTIRVLLRLIVYYKKPYHNAFIYVLVRLFTFSDDDVIRTLLIYFFTTYCQISHAHQCLMGAVCVDALVKLAKGDLTEFASKVNINDMITFVAQVTSFSVLHPNALGRENGSAHLYLASRILLKLDSVYGDEEGYLEYFCTLLHLCEVSEVFDPKKIEEVLKACLMRREEVSSSRYKKNIEGYMKRIESAKKHAESKKAIARPEIVPKSVEELERELQELVTQLKLTDENTGTDKRSWLSQPIASNEHAILLNMKIFGGHSLTMEEILRRYLDKNAPPTKKTLSSIKRANTNPRAITTPRKKMKEATIEASSSISSNTPLSRAKKPTPGRSIRRRPLKEKLNSVPEVEEEDFI